ncbi:DNA-directed RNA polymerase subunit alpha C-terminal domain-containing protein [Paenibacillus sp. L3-i20]|uniref:DNA-directed RNA polymerase subunit alpha C-terminal domain-containing protein n=1 Tax=Paenibacillus sp. L3-i20 TaxID=2905833 RepID=UPI001EE0E56C|nr:DNA-directed RNA polymerase subunit alpha C-terminal domain-containing protein [Paenibacillus sp. L3-i20]GKU77197.1 hypothetical protein L3i20_v215940 [Paenibacillus sp. L3-i20]
MRYVTLTDTIEKIDLSVRSRNALYRAGINTIAKILDVTEEELGHIKNLGSKSIEEILVAITDIKSGHKDICVVAESDVQALENERVLQEAVFFRNREGLLCKDIPIDQLEFSVRAYNCLHSSGIKYASELTDIKIEDLLGIKNMGSLSAKEILSVMQNIVFQTSDDLQTKSEKIPLVNEICSSVILEIKKYIINAHAGLLYQEAESIIEEYISTHPDIKELKIELITSIYNANFFQVTVKHFLIELVEKFRYGTTTSTLLNYLPKHLDGTAIVEKMVSSLISDDLIAVTSNGALERKYLTVQEYARTLYKEKDRTLFEERMNGVTLEEIGQQYGVTRERVRQIVLKHMNNRPHLREDRYADVFRKYSFSKADFSLLFNEPLSTFNYLSLAYEPGTIALDMLVEDEFFPIEYRRGAEKVVYKNYLSIGSDRVRRNRSDLVDYIIRNYCNDEVSFDEFSELYLMFLKDYGLERDERLFLSDRTYENKLADSDYVLWKYGRRFRYYNIEAYDFNDLLQILDLEQYQDIEFSTLKFFVGYQEFMRNYDIRDEYELHNLLKKLYKRTNNINIKFKRMPNIEIGTANRDEQMLDILLQFAPVSNVDLAAAYEEAYGVHAETVLANHLKNFDEYYFDGMYKIDAKPLLSEQSSRMSECLGKDFYPISEVKRIYLREFTNADSHMINPYTLKLLGFRVYSTYAIRNKFQSASDYFRYLLLEKDIIDSRTFPRELVSTVAYTSELYRLKSLYELVEYLPSEYINIRRLNSAGISAEKLQDYCDCIYKYIERGEYFTVKSLRKKGFEHPLDHLGFEDWFYSSILTEDNKRFSYRRMGGSKVFIKGNQEVTLGLFIEFLVEYEKSIDIYDLNELLLDTYGLNAERYRMISIINNSSMYYDPIMEKIYIDYDTYFEEV